MMEIVHQLFCALPLKHEFGLVSLKTRRIADRRLVIDDSLGFFFTSSSLFPAEDGVRRFTDVVAGVRGDVGRHSRGDGAPGPRQLPQLRLPERRLDVAGRPPVPSAFRR